MQNFHPPIPSLSLTATLYSEIVMNSPGLRPSLKLTGKLLHPYNTERRFK